MTAEDTRWLIAAHIAESNAHRGALDDRSLRDLHVVTMWLSVIRPEHIQQDNLYLTTSGTLWVKRQQMAFLPVAARGFDDQVVLWPDDDGDEPDPGGGPLWGVRRRYWDSNGLANLELTRMVLDPSENSQQKIVQELGRDMPTYSSWWTETDGDPEPKLERGGWAKS